MSKRNVDALVVLAVEQIMTLGVSRVEAGVVGRHERPVATQLAAVAKPASCDHTRTRARTQRVVNGASLSGDVADIFARFIDHVTFIASPLVGVRSIAINVSVCLSVRSHISKMKRPNFTKFSVRYLLPWLGPPLATAQ